MAQFADLVARLAAVPQGAGKLIDSTALIITSETSDADPHRGNDMPILLAGGSSFIKGDFHWRGAGQHPAGMTLALLQKLGCPVTRLGGFSQPLAAALD